MTILEAIRENFEHMRAAKLVEAGVDEYDVEPYGWWREFGDLEFTSRESRRGKKGRVFTVFRTARGPVGFVPWPDPYIWWFKEKKA